MTTRDHDTIDFVTYDHAGDRMTLVLVENRPWGVRGENLSDLQEKLNTYLIYVIDGQLVNDFPMAQGKRVSFQLRTAVALGDREMEFLQIVENAHLRPAGIDLEIHVSSLH
jgi:hypothetical protein